MDNLGETEKSDSSLSREQEEGPPLKQLRLGRGAGRPKRLPELNGTRGRRRERASCKSGQSSSSTLHARPRKSKLHKHQNGETAPPYHPPPLPHTSAPSPVFINLCSPSPTSTNASTPESFTLRMPSLSTSADSAVGTQPASVDSHVSVSHPPSSVLLPSHSASNDVATSSGATSLPTDSSLLVDTYAMSRHPQTGTTSVSSASTALGTTTETPSINSTHSHNYLFRLRPRRNRPTSSNQNQTTEAQSRPSSNHILASQSTPSASTSNLLATEPQSVISSLAPNVTSNSSIHVRVHANTVSGLTPVVSGSASRSTTPWEPSDSRLTGFTGLPTLSGSQSSQSLSGTVMGNYWSNVRSQLDRSTAFIASQSIRRTSNSSRIPLHLRGMDHDQQSNSAESNSQGTSTVLITPRSSRQANRNTSSRPPRPTPRWHGNCPFRLLHSFEPSSQGPSSAVSGSSNPGPWQVPHPLQDSASSLIHDFDSMYSSDDDFEVPPSRDRSSPTRRSEWRMNFTGSRRAAGATQTVPSTGGHSQSSEVEVIVVDSEDDEEDDVIIGTVEEGNSDSRQRQIANDEAFARELQEQFDREASAHIPPSPHIWSARGPSGAVPVVSMNFSVSSTPASPPEQEEDDDDDEEGTRLVHDNFDALASRVRSWTTADAARFLRVATHRGRRRPRNRQEFMNAVIDLSPTLLYQAILGPSFGGSTNTYEDLLELAERLGPARPQGLSRQDINSLPVREFSGASDSQGSNSGATQCVVCMCDFEEGEKVTTLPCIHDFHQRCITQWLKDHRTCPICRVAVRV